MASAAARQPHALPSNHSDHDSQHQHDGRREAETGGAAVHLSLPRPHLPPAGGSEPLRACGGAFRSSPRPCAGAPPSLCEQTHKSGRFEKPSRFAVWADSVRLVSGGRGMGRQPGFFDVDERLTPAERPRRSAGGVRGGWWTSRCSGRPGCGARLFGWREGRPPAARSGDDVQGPGDPGRTTTCPTSGPSTSSTTGSRSCAFWASALGDRVPDARTIWLFRERLTQAVIEGRPAIEVLFARFDAALRAAGYIADVGPDRGRHAGRGAAPAQHRRPRRPTSRPAASRPSGRPGPPSCATRTGTRAGR